ncbi:MAG: acyl-CoA carboxylase subunit epsilon [Actinomycetota bacterium]|nr:acyl-CoA carboxylase subunit epsilon [Actinomycetota bacterium]
MTERVLRVVRGTPTAEELAAVVAVLTARSAPSAAPAAADQGPPQLWTARAPLLRRPVHPGPGAWRASGLPL